MSGLSFNEILAAPLSGNGPIPPGTYRATVTSCEATVSKSSEKNMLVMEMEVEYEEKGVKRVGSLRYYLVSHYYDRNGQVRQIAAFNALLSTIGEKFHPDKLKNARGVIAEDRLMADLAGVINKTPLQADIQVKHESRTYFTRDGEEVTREQATIDSLKAWHVAAKAAAGVNKL